MAPPIPPAAPTSKPMAINFFLLFLLCNDRSGEYGLNRSCLEGLIPKYLLHSGFRQFVFTLN